MSIISILSSPVAINLYLLISPLIIFEILYHYFPLVRSIADAIENKFNEDSISGGLVRLIFPLVVIPWYIAAGLHGTFLVLAFSIWLATGGLVILAVLFMIVATIGWFLSPLVDGRGPHDW